MPNRQISPSAVRSTAPASRRPVRALSSSAGPTPDAAELSYQPKASFPSGVMRAKRQAASPAHWMSCRPVRSSA